MSTILNVDLEEGVYMRQYPGFAQPMRLSMPQSLSLFWLYTIFVSNHLWHALILGRALLEK